MKQTLLLVVLMFSAAAGIAQKIRFTDTSNKWTFIYFTDDPTANVERGWYGTDTLIAGRSYKRLYTSETGIINYGLALREDTLQEKIFFRYITAGADTSEQLYFDYGFKAGDTLKIKNGIFKYNYVIKKRDSVQLGSAYYRHWIFQPAPFSNSEFIEGIGSNYYPGQLARPYYGLGGAQLRCFSNKGTSPKCKPPIPLPFANAMPIRLYEPYGAAFFDNDTSCNIRRMQQQPGAVLGALAAQQISVFPNPGGGAMVIKLPDAVMAAALHVKDISGRMVLVQMVQPGNTFPIGQYVTAPGVYTYTLQDAATGRRYTGRFLRQ